MERIRRPLGTVLRGGPGGAAVPGTGAERWRRGAVGPAARCRARRKNKMRGQAVRLLTTACALYTRQHAGFSPRLDGARSPHRLLSWGPLQLGPPSARSAQSASSRAGCVSDLGVGQRRMGCGTSGLARLSGARRRGGRLGCSDSVAAQARPRLATESDAHVAPSQGLSSPYIGALEKLKRARESRSGCAGRLRRTPAARALPEPGMRAASERRPKNGAWAEPGRSPSSAQAAPERRPSWALVTSERHRCIALGRHPPRMSGASGTPERGASGAPNSQAPQRVAFCQGTACFCNRALLVTTPEASPEWRVLLDSGRGRGAVEDSRMSGGGWAAGMEDDRGWPQRSPRTHLIPGFAEACRHTCARWPCAGTPRGRTRPVRMLRPASCRRRR